jgi:hypothetical protein
VIEQRLDDVERYLPHQRATRLAWLAGAVVVGLLLSRIPLLRLVGTGARTVQTGLTVAGTVAAVDRFLAEQRGGRLAA